MRAREAAWETHASRDPSAARGWVTNGSTPARCAGRKRRRRFRPATSPRPRQSLLSTGTTPIRSLRRHGASARSIWIIGGDYTRSSDIRIDSEDYLKKLIAIASGNAVSGKAKRMQFYVVRGGAEGMLPDDLRGINANSNETSWTGTDGKPGRTIFDENDLIAVFAPDGTLIGSARLRR